MRKLRVGVIDSGINESALKNRVHHVYCFDGIKKDQNGHGTMCAYLIEKYSRREIEFFSYKIFGENLKATLESIEYALKKVLYDNLDLINLSLSIHVEERKEIENLLDSISKNGTIIIAANAKNGNETFLNHVNTVRTVEGKSFFNEELVIEGKNRTYCDSEPIISKWHKNEYDFIGGNSKAAALYSAHICRQLVKEKCKERNIAKEISPVKISRNDWLNSISKNANINKIDVENNNWREYGNIFLFQIIGLLKDVYGDELFEKKTIFMDDLSDFSKFWRFLCLL